MDGRLSEGDDGDIGSDGGGGFGGFSSESEDRSGSHSSSGSEYYSSDDESSFSSGSSFGDFDDTNADAGDGAYWGGLLSTFRNRRPTRQSQDGENGRRYDTDNRTVGLSDDDDDDDDDEKYGRSRPRRRHGEGPRNLPWGDAALALARLRLCPRLNRRRATTALLASVLTWLCAQIRRAQLDPPGAAGGFLFSSSPRRPGGPLTAEERRRRRREAQRALGTAAGRLDRRGGGSREKRSGGAAPEGLPAGCAPSGWQTSGFPNCNDVHEIDLREALHLRRGGPRLPNMGRGDLSPDERGATGEQWENARASGYVGSGLWRSVWTVDPRGEAAGAVEGEGATARRHHPAVLKVMKLEHKYDFRNFDRHRRDALVMERLTSSKYVVDVYGYCGNTVLTEYAGLTLDKVIYRPEEEEEERGSAQNGMMSYEGFTRETPEGRLRLALDVFRGLAAIHDVPGGPIIHADIQAKQYLVDPSAGVVKLNDYNRCRFMPHSNATGAACPVRIPQAPGANRSPEEYEGGSITEKADVYSAANILYGILMGRKHWDRDKTSTIKEFVKAGRKPLIGAQFRRPGTTDAMLADLMERAYEFKPAKRISASEMVKELEKIMAAKDDDAKDSNPSFRKNRY